MSFNGVSVNKLNGGLGRTSDQPDRVVVLVCGVVSLPAMMIQTANFCITT
jgi:hypothetical protein